MNPLTAGWVLWTGIAGWMLLLVPLLWGTGVWLSHVYIKYWLLRGYSTARATEVAVILPGVNWRSPIAWLKPNFHSDDIKIVLAHAGRGGKNVSVYNDPDLNTVERLMRDKTVREVYFVGHGGTDFFRLGTEDVLCYCRFNDPEKYGKDFVHQVHCGTACGKSLREHVVPETNWPKCFFHPDKIDSYFMEKEFRRLVELE